ncbi:hypothetical protein [Haloferula sp. BvORR071]|uniref:hypothetical protein n=1 Tax=Haloferula sp. BvORR071 TaxID=1396141 RepID=UPI0005587D36|nr:hypothetical protein [Haloferula sp. BvORR071]
MSFASRSIPFIRLFGSVCCLLALTTTALRAKTIRWFSDPLKDNRTSSGAAMDGGFRFELGVFTGGFTPTSANTADWASHWASAQRAVYNESNRLFTAQFTVTSNASPFTAGAQAWVWGFGGTSGREWILFRALSWTWPEPDPIDPIGFDWNADDATQVVLGAIKPPGSPAILMRSAAVSNSAPPASTFNLWRVEELSDVALNGPDDDPDGDGIPNILEYLFGTRPRSRDALPVTPISIVEISGQRYLQISIPRRLDRPATLITEVSTDLALWSSGPTYTQVTASAPDALLVRALAPLGSATPRLFMRMRATP